MGFWDVMMMMEKKNNYYNKCQYQYDVEAILLLVFANSGN